MKWQPVGENPACQRVNTAGVPFEEFSCLYAASLGRTYTETEVNADVPAIRDWMLAHPWVPLAAVMVYVLWMVLGGRYFSRHQPWNLRGTMALWNVLLSVFSLLGMFRTWPQLAHNLYHYSLPENMCMDPESAFGSGSTGIWLNMFVLSKIPELLDTFFIVIHKKKLIFLHWYHHISVLLYCWHSYVTKSPPGLLFCAMNYAVHGVMYGYYALMALQCKPRWFRAVWITVAQISQMVVGVAATLYGWYIIANAPTKYQGCWLDRENNLAATLMYGSYLALFLQFFVGRYFRKGSDAARTSNQGKKKKE